MIGSAQSDAILEISLSIVEDDVIGPGDTFHVISEIRNRESEGRIDVIVTYEVLCPGNSVILSDTKTVAVETKSSFAEEFTLPNYISEGSYILRANVTTLDGSKWSEASRSFNVIRVSEDEQMIIQYVIIIALVLTSGGFIFEHRRITKLKVSNDDLKRFIKK